MRDGRWRFAAYVVGGIMIVGGIAMTLYLSDDPAGSDERDSSDPTLGLLMAMTIVFSVPALAIYVGAIALIGFLEARRSRSR